MINKILKTIKKVKYETPTVAVFGGGWMMDGDWGWNNMMGWGFGSGTIMVLFWIIAILAIIALLLWLAENLNNNTSTSNKAMEILKEKYAKGEITKEEFETKKKDII
jgi:putative membrane protein